MSPVRFVELDGDTYQALYELAEDRGLVIPGATGDRDPIRVFAGEILSAYVKAKGPTIEKIRARKLKQEIEADEAASERLLEGRRLGRAITGLAAPPDEGKGA